MHISSSSASRYDLLPNMHSWYTAPQTKHTETQRLPVLRWLEDNGSLLGLGRKHSRARRFYIFRRTVRGSSVARRPCFPTERGTVLRRVAETTRRPEEGRRKPCSPNFPGLGLQHWRQLRRCLDRERDHAPAVGQAPLACLMDRRSDYARARAQHEHTRGDCAGMAQSRNYCV